jgi:DNA-binding MarR family transcriptional regulator
MSKTIRREIDPHHTSWQAEGEVLHHLLLRAILKNNPIPAVYRINYVANFFIGPLVKEMEQSFKLTRPEWIVLFCLTQQPRLNAMQISTVTGRAKTSVSGAIKLLQKKKLITRKTDAADSRRQVLHLTPAGQDTYKAIIGKFVAREADVLACLSASERRTLIKLFDKMIVNGKNWTLPY